MKTPDRIWLINLGDEVIWHGDPKPTGYEEAQDSVEYVRVGSQAGSEPAGYFRNVTGDDDLIQRWEQSEWADDGAVPLCAHPPAAELEALRRDAEIGKLVRLKMTSGNGVPVERCIITAAEIEAIAQQEAP